MSEPLFQILPTDTRWPGPYYVEEGPDCLCSRCLEPILESEIAVRCWPEDPDRDSYRFHPACLWRQEETYDEQMPGMVIWPPKETP